MITIHVTLIIKNLDTTNLTKRLRTSYPMAEVDAPESDMMSLDVVDPLWCSAIRKPCR
jgi:hypothetical protein